MTKEQRSPLKENPSLRLTPEEIEKSREAKERLDQAIIQGLHQGNLEIFGRDYLNPKS